MKIETEVRLIIISNPLGCPYRGKALGNCLAVETAWNECAPECSPIDFPSYCPLKKETAIISQEDKVGEVNE